MKKTALLLTRSLMAATMIVSCTLSMIPAATIQAQEPEEEPSSAGEQTLEQVTAFSDGAIGRVETDEESGTVHMLRMNGDHFAMYTGSNNKMNDFTFEADVEILSGDPRSAGLVFGANHNTAVPSSWNAANIDMLRKNEWDLYRTFGPNVGNDTHLDHPVEFDETKLVHLKFDVDASGFYTYTFGNVGADQYSFTGLLQNWQGGYIGLLSFCSETVFSNITLTDRTVEQSAPELSDLVNDGSWHTDLQDLQTAGGTWSFTEEGLRCQGLDQGDCFLQSQTAGTDFVWQSEMQFNAQAGAAGLVFRGDNDLSCKNSYAMNLSPEGKVKLWRWQDGDAYQLMDEKQVSVSPDGRYLLQVSAIGGKIACFVNGENVYTTGDYTVQSEDKGQGTALMSGYFGLVAWNADVTFQNSRVLPLTEAIDPSFTEIRVDAEGQDLQRGQFFTDSPVYIQMVPHETEQVYLSAKTVSDGCSILIRDAEGQEYQTGESIPVREGANILTVISAREEDGMVLQAVNKVNVHRMKHDTYYDEAFRNQIHFSLKEGWGNDPNGLCCYRGKWHLFFQYYDDIQWGPMHWGHAVSTDLINWTEEPIALYPDMNGTMFSGCIAADETNQSGLFSTDQGGLIAFITCDGNGQRIKLAISEDEGKTWSKQQEIAADWSQDVLGNRDFRDPKVFRWDGKWFMVIAGGPLRIYSSENMVDWKCESAYPDLHTECPDLYPLEIEGRIKWVLSRGGRYYKIGDFREENGSWRFIPDAEYENADGIMNFGNDYYAAMTFYVQDFGTAENPTIPDIISLSWMNTWADGICNQVAEKAGTDFNGTYNLMVRNTLAEKDGRIVLQQTPLPQYESLRQNAVISLESETAGKDNTLLQDFQGDVYEICARITPQEGTESFGFKLRTSADQQTVIAYDVNSQTLSMDRSASGIQINDAWSRINSQSGVTLQEDGSLEMHIFVDRASAEMYCNSGQVLGSQAIFPDPSSLGASFFVNGEPVTLDLQIYPLSSIWKQNAPVTGSARVLLQEAVHYAEAVMKDPEYSLVNSIVREHLFAMLEEARTVLADKDASESQITEAWKNLTAAIQMSGFTSDKRELQKLVEQALPIAENIDNYQGDTEAFLTALYNAQEVLASETALDARIQEALEALQSAMNGLTEKEPVILDPSLLAMLTEAVRDTQAERYTAGTWSAFETALQQAEAVLAAPESQPQIDAAVSSLHQAWLNLRLKADENLLGQLQQAQTVFAVAERSLYSSEFLAQMDDCAEQISNALQDPANLEQKQAESLVQQASPLMETILNKEPDLTVQQPAQTLPGSGAAVSKDQSRASSVKTASVFQAGAWSAAGLTALAVLTASQRRKHQK